jgi:hypothetical protein
VLRTACDGWDYCTRDLSSGAHPNYAPDHRKSLDYALTGLLLTRGEGVVNEIAFATQLGWEPTEPGLATYAIQKLRHLAQTEQDEIKSSACETLWIYTVDRIDQSLRRSASDSMHASNCQCVTKPDGNVACR